MKTKLILIIIILLALAGLEQVKTQEPIDLEIVWQKEVFPKEIRFAHFSSDGQWIYAATNNAIEKISVEIGEFESYLLQIIPLVDFGFTNNDIMIATDRNGTVVLLDCKNEMTIKNLNYTSDPNVYARCVTISPDAIYAICGTVNSEDNMNQSNIIVVNNFTDEIIRNIRINGVIEDIQISHNGKYFATGSWHEYNDGAGKKYYDQVILWSTETWAPVDTIETLGGVGSGYDEIKFSMDDKYLGCVRHYPSDGRIYNIENKELIQSAESDCYSFEFLPDNYHYLLYYNDQKLGRMLNLYNPTGLLETFDIPSTNIVSFGNDTNFKIFCNTGKISMTMLKNTIVGIETQFLENGIINISLINNQIIIQIENIFQKILLCEIVDVKGKVVFSQIIENNNPNGRILLNPILITGIYICNVKFSDKIYSQKIEIVR